MDEFRKRALFVVLLCVAAILFLYFLWVARYILLLVFASCIGALVLSALTDRLRTWFPVSRGVAFGIVVCGLVFLTVLGIWTRGTLLVQQLGDLQVNLPAAIHQVHLELQAQAWGRWLLAQLTDSDQLARGTSFLLAGLGGAMYATGVTVAAIVFAHLRVFMWLQSRISTFADSDASFPKDNGHSLIAA